MYKIYEQIRKKEELVTSAIKIILLAAGYTFLILVLNGISVI